MPAALIPSELIENKIFFIRGKKVMVDRDLTVEESKALRSQFATSSWGG